jgi:hypothetical protein
VFLQGVPWESLKHLHSVFEQFGPMMVKWPGREKSPTKTKGYAYTSFLRRSNRLKCCCRSAELHPGCAEHGKLVLQDFVLPHEGQGGAGDPLDDQQGQLRQKPLHQAGPPEDCLCWSPAWNAERRGTRQDHERAL